MTDEEKLDAERRELNTLISRGVNFDIERIVYRRKWLVGKREKFTEKQRFNIQEPTLAVLDLLSAEQIELVIDEKTMQSAQGVSVAKKMTHDHNRRMARIIAIAVLGEDYFITEQIGAHTRHTRDDKRLNELTSLFQSTIKPSKLIQLTILINQMANLGDFINSIRLMSASRTTMPILVEEGKQD